MNVITDTETAKDDLAHAKSNADSHAESILELYQGYQAMEGGVDEAVLEGEIYEDVDALCQAARERALSVEVRSGWYVPGTNPAQPSRFKILLTTGGPALQLTGELSGYGEPERYLTLQVQDWGTPWTDYDPGSMLGKDDWDAALLWFASLFYYSDE